MSDVSDTSRDDDGRGAPADAWSVDAGQLMGLLGTSIGGLTSQAAAERLERGGPNLLESRRHGGTWRLLGAQFTDPIELLLIGAALLALLLGDVVDAGIILAIVGLSGLLGFAQERRAGHAIEQLSALVRIHADVRRDGRSVEVPVEGVVVGDVLELSAGDLVAGDCRLIEATDLLVDASTLTGEAYPVHRTADDPHHGRTLVERTDVLLLGSHVVSGRGVAVCVATGSDTHLGRLAGDLGRRPRRSAFERGIGRFGLLVARVTMVLAAAILMVNVLLGRPLVDSVLFALALAVGLTPQMLPVIVSVSLATGARHMSTRRVIVRRLDAIEDFGSMDVLCTDKTGTLTEGRIELASALDAAGAPDAEVARLAAINAGLQSAFPNPLDVAIADAHPVPDGVERLDEVPFDFSRRRLGVLARDDGREVLIVKGAFRAVLDVCDTVQVGGRAERLEAHRDRIERHFEELGGQGLRVLGVATAAMPDATRANVADEQGLTLRGLLTFADPPKADAAAAVQRLSDTGVSLRMLTGDNRFAAAHAASRVGLDASRVLTGADLDGMDDDELRFAARSTMVFAELDPLDKERVIEALHADGLTVGYLGDGINDAGALRQADVGITVDTAVDVARQTAAIVLLDKDLGVLTDGVELGRQTFANTLKYVFTTVSANFGNVASMAAASAFLSFLPLLPRQILLLNFLSDIPSTMIAGDRVDPEQRDRPQHWNVRFVRDFMITFGLVSTAFDLLTFAILLQVFAAGPTLFRTGWFVGSTLTELAVLFVLRTRRPALRSRPGNALVVTSVLVGVTAISLPFIPRMAGPLGLEPLPVSVLVTLVAIVAGYVVVTEAVKPRFHRWANSTHARGPGANADGHPA